MSAIAPCLKCGTETDHIVEFAYLFEGTVFMCRGCFAPAYDEFLDLKRQFDELIEAGVERDEANAIMIARIEQGGLQ